jgi:hypothetical protein
MPLFSWIFSRPEPVRHQLPRRPIRPDETTQKFRSEKDNVIRMRGLWRDPFFQKVLRVLYNSRPRGFPPRGYKPDALEIALELGRGEGHEAVLGMLELMTVPMAETEDIPATWEDPNEQAQAEDEGETT